MLLNPVPPHSSHTHLLTSTMKNSERPALESAPFSPPLAMQQSVWDSTVKGNFIDAKIFAFSRRTLFDPLQVDTPKALFVNTHVLEAAYGYFKTSASSFPLEAPSNLSHSVQLLRRC